MLRNILKRLAQPFLDSAVAAGKASAEAEVEALGVRIETAISVAVAKHVDGDTHKAIMSEVDTALYEAEAEVDAKIKAFHVKL